MEDPKSRQLSFCGIRMDALELDELMKLMIQAQEKRDKLVILNHNMHSLYLHEVDQKFRDSYRQASWVYVDGLPVIWLAKLAGLPMNGAHRITFVDCFHNILDEAAQRGWRVFYLGSNEEVNTTAIPMLRERHRGLIIAGHHGFFAKSGAENERMIEHINNFGTDILFVGMGMPIQEKWVAENHEKLAVSSVLTSGGTLNYVTGHAKRPPEWIGRLGMYGAYRLFSEPRRLFGRYIIEPLHLSRYLTLKLIQQRLGYLGSYWPSPESLDRFESNSPTIQSAEAD